MQEGLWHSYMALTVKFILTHRQCRALLLRPSKAQMCVLWLELSIYVQSEAVSYAWQIWSKWSFQQTKEADDGLLYIGFTSYGRCQCWHQRHYKLFIVPTWWHWSVLTIGGLKRNKPSAAWHMFPTMGTPFTQMGLTTHSLSKSSELCA